MPDFNTWLGWNDTGEIESWYDDYTRESGIGFMIGHRGISITLQRGTSTTIAAQDMLLVPAGRNVDANERVGDTTVSANETLILVALPTANIERGDRFSYKATPANRLNYRVTRVERAIYGMIQAYVEVVT